MESELKCPVKATAKALAGKWKVQIVWHLGVQSQRFAELRNLLPGVSEKVLTEHLRQLENAGILQRIATPSAPLRVDCKLTAAGRDLAPVMQELWAGARNTWGRSESPPSQRFGTNGFLI
jgi:DNA-binding HxlR family transcriptional regulator